ncbi:MAG TPA: CPBP family glutamic-type intramembrane protease [Nocardioidaceae bacterium]|nr:CPBP family glutamic-type intramembrane protease [Nocardioidaceae bacterium]
MSEQYPGGRPPNYGGQQPAPPPSYPGGQPQPWGGPPAPQQPWGGPPAPQQPWAGPPAPGAGQPRRPVLPSFPHPAPREYHQMLRTWNYAWWKPVVGIILVALGMVVVAPLVLLPLLMVGVWLEGGPFWSSFEEAATLQSIGPASLLYLNLTLGSAILVCWLVMRVLHRMRPRWLTSVVPKMRWRFFFICVGFSVVALIAQVVVSVLMPGSQEGDPTATVNEFTRTTAILALVVLLTTPLQAAGEEYVFRGYLMQAVGSLFNNRWVALVATATLFAVAHGVQNFPLFFDRFMFGLIAGWLVLRTGGLEAGIAMHILNNFLAFGYALTFSDLTSTLNVTEVGWENIPLTLTQAGTYAALVLVAAKKLNLQTRTNPPYPPQSAEAPAAVEAPAS